MSPDDVFAAQMWPWPDPVIKRDSAGRVLFINAAFLSLYGGRVETWTGQPVMGWPAPNPQGHPYRFETRAGTAPDDIIYDWVEVMMADGTALAIARDVTAYKPPAHTQAVPQTDNVTVAPPPADLGAAPAAPSAAFSQAEEDAQPADASAPLQTPPQAFDAPVSAAPEPQAVEPQAPELEPAFEPAPEQISEQISEPAFEPVSETASAPQFDMTQAAAPQEPAPLPVEPPAPEPAAPEPVQAAAPAPSPQIAPEGPAEPAAAPAEAPPAAQTEPPARDFERRALPIENEDAVLGSNWRDAVIARAVGSAVAPAEQEAEPAPAPQMPAQAGGSEPLRILLAEDNAINALLTRTLLEADGCVVETVEDGALAVDAVKNNNYDLILMDMRMPNMDGLEATRKIRAMGGKRADDLPIIALTANAFDDDRNACFDSGMNDFMTKPVSAEELTAMVAQWVEKTRAPGKAALAG